MVPKNEGPESPHPTAKGANVQSGELMRRKWVHTDDLDDLVQVESKRVERRNRVSIPREPTSGRSHEELAQLTPEGRYEEEGSLAQAVETGKSNNATQSSNAERGAIS